MRPCGDSVLLTDGVYYLWCLPVAVSGVSGLTEEVS